MKVNEITNEAVSKVPQSTDEVRVLKELFSNPIPAHSAVDALAIVIVDDALAAEIMHKAEMDPEFDVRPVVQKWIELNMPELVNPAGDENESGFLSPISGHPEDVKDFSE